MGVGFSWFMLFSLFALAFKRGSESAILAFICLYVYAVKLFRVVNWYKNIAFFSRVKEIDVIGPT